MERKERKKERRKEKKTEKFKKWVRFPASNGDFPPLKATSN